MECRGRGGRGLVFPHQVTDAACTLKEFSVTLSARLLGVRSRAGRTGYLRFRLDSGIVRDDEEFTCPARRAGLHLPEARLPPRAVRLAGGARRPLRRWAQLPDSYRRLQGPEILVHAVPQRLRLQPLRRGRRARRQTLRRYGQRAARVRARRRRGGLRGRAVSQALRRAPRPGEGRPLPPQEARAP
jgi:hypothetical protein